MLSRVAERIYWLSRYMERAENTARLVNVYSSFLMDLPKGTQVGWDTVITILGNDEDFYQQYEQADERSVTRFMLAQKNNFSSIFSSLQMARENARTTREIIPSEAWELINDLYLYTKDNAARGVARAGRNSFLLKIISCSQQLAGMLTNCMSHNHAYDFVLIGRNIERADMSSRIIDVAAAVLLHNKDEADLPYENALWMNVLRSLSAYQMYRQHVRVRISADDVIAFLLKNEQFPRATFYTLNMLANATQELPNNEECLRSVASTRRRVLEADPAQLLAEGTLHEYIDTLQLDIAGIHQAVNATWFSRESLAVTQTQMQSQSQV